MTLLDSTFSAHGDAPEVQLLRRAIIPQPPSVSVTLNMDRMRIVIARDLVDSINLFNVIDRSPRLPSAMLQVLDQAPEQLPLVEALSNGLQRQTASQPARQRSAPEQFIRRPSPGRHSGTRYAQSHSSPRRLDPARSRPRTGHG